MFDDLVAAALDFGQECPFQIIGAHTSLIVRRPTARSTDRVVLDAYNLLGLSNSVEEETTAPPNVRITTAVQPPRTLHLGLRVTF